MQSLIFSGDLLFSPYTSRGNGKAEPAVKTTKYLLKNLKAVFWIWLFVMAKYTSIKVSPAQRLSLEIQELFRQNWLENMKPRLAEAIRE